MDAVAIQSLLSSSIDREARAVGSRRVALLLIVASFVVYNANMREISSADTIGTRLVPIAVIRDHGLILDRYFRSEPTSPYWVQRVGEHHVSSYPILPGLLAVPVYFLPILALGDGSWALINLLAKLSASLQAALSVGFMYLVLREVAPASTAAAAALVYAFGTSTWSVSSQGLWGHAAAQLFMAAAIYCALRGTANRRFIEYGGLLSGLMVASRPTTVFVAAALLGHGLVQDRRHGVRALLLFAAATLPFAGYNLWYFGSLQGGYAELHTSHSVYHGVETAWVSVPWEGLLGLLFSPNRGLLVYSPVLVLAAGGIVSALRPPTTRLPAWLLAGLVASLLLMGTFSVWWGGHSFGPRLLTDFLALLILLLVPAWRALARSRAGRAVLVVLVAASVVVQLVGVFYYPSPREMDWNTSPRDVDTAHERLWDWRDTQLLRLLRNGPRPPGFGSLG